MVGYSDGGLVIVDVITLVKMLKDRLIKRTNDLHVAYGALSECPRFVAFLHN